MRKSSLSIVFCSEILSRRQALFNNWLPLFVVATFLMAPVPNAVCGKIAGRSDYMDDEATSAALDFGRFLTGFLLLSGLAVPVMLAHVGSITTAAAIMSILGGALIYGSIIVYGQFFSVASDDF